jgi:small subunit ribosomal protein S11
MTKKSFDFAAKRRRTKNTNNFYFYRPRSRKRIFDFRNINHRYFKILFFRSNFTNTAGTYPRFGKVFRFNYLTSFSDVAYKQFFFYAKRVGRYDKNAVRQVPPKLKRFRYSLFSNQGLNARSFLVRNKYFFKRRSIHNFFKYNLSNTNSFTYRSTIKFFSSIKFHLHIRQTKNNLFFFLKTSNGRLIFCYTNGQTIYKGSRRTTPTASELAGKQVSKFLFINKIKDICLVFDTPLTSLVKSAVRGLSTRLSFSAMLAYRFVSHNGIKPKATRRV